MKVNEIFYSLQGEGLHTGTAAVFLRLSGCNVRCAFCDTQHQEGKEMSEEEIVSAVSHYPTRHIVITGGEPTLQITALLTTLLHQAGFYIQIETNGSTPLPEGCEPDWVTCSPKSLPVRIQRIDELKVLFDGERPLYADQAAITAMMPGIKELRLQPIDSGDEEKNKKTLKETINYILSNPKWKLSLQTHKIINIQ